jgi:hypothetical protein
MSKTAELQEKFLAICQEMVDSKVDLPESFELFYTIKHDRDRYGTALTIIPYLTKEEALENCKESSESSGRYWHTCEYKVKSGSKWDRKSMTKIKLNCM